MHRRGVGDCVLATEDDNGVARELLRVEYVADAELDAFDEAVDAVFEASRTGSSTRNGCTSQTSSFTPGRSGVAVPRPRRRAAARGGESVELFYGLARSRS